MYSPIMNQYETKVYTPLRTESSGMYSFHKGNSEASDQIWFLHLKISDTQWNRLIWSDNGASSINNSQVYIDPDNYLQIVIPCSIKYYVNSSEVSLHFGNVCKVSCIKRDFYSTELIENFYFDYFHRSMLPNGVGA